MHGLVASITEHCSKVRDSSLVQDVVPDAQDTERRSAGHSQPQVLLEIALDTIISVLLKD